MPMISDQTLQRLSDWITDEVLKDTCDILRQSQTLGPMGSPRPTWAASNSEPVPCALVDARRGGAPAELTIAAQQSGIILKMALLPRGTDVLGTDRLVILDVTYHIIDLYEPSSYEVVRRVLVRRLTIPTTT